MTTAVVLVVVGMVAIANAASAAGVVTTAVPPRSASAPPPSPMPAAAAPPAPAAAAPMGTAPIAPNSPIDAATSLERVRAAYEYGDVDGVVEWARPVAEGRMPATAVERGYALRYLGIGLFLTGRAPGAEAAFFELLRMRPDSTLDPRTTRPDVVAFFEQVRSRHAVEIRKAARENNHRIFVLNFLPPLGQIQNGHRGRAFLYGGLELVSAATAVTTYTMLSRSERADYTHANYDQASTLKIVNYVAVGVFAATYLVGVLDGLASYSDLPDETPPPRGPAAGVSLGLGPTGLAMTF